MHTLCVRFHWPRTRVRQDVQEDAKKRKATDIVLLLVFNKMLADGISTGHEDLSIHQRAGKPTKRKKKFINKGEVLCLCFCEEQKRTYAGGDHLLQNN